MSETPNGTVSLKEALLDGTKNELIRTAKVLGAPCSAKMKKGEIAECVSKFVLEDPDRFLSGLFLFELDLVDQICNIDSRHCITGPIMDFQQSLYKMNILLEFENGDGSSLKIGYDLPYDLKRALKGHIKEAINRDNEEDHVPIVLAMALLNIYGFLPFQALESILEDFPSYNKKDSVLRSKYLFKFGTHSVIDDTNIICSPFLDYETLLNHTELFGNRESEANFTLLDDIKMFKWGQMPFPVMSVHCAQPVLKQLRKILPGVGTAEGLLTNYWAYAQTAESPSQSLRYILAELDMPISKIEPILQPLIEFANKMPRWKFSGNSSEDMYRSHSGKKPSFSIKDIHPRTHFGDSPFGGDASFGGGSNIYPFPGNIQPVKPDPGDFEAMLYAGINPRTGKKIMPNDPCPCGSGLKYKKCHGSKGN